MRVIREVPFRDLSLHCSYVVRLEWAELDQGVVVRGEFVCFRIVTLIVMIVRQGDLCDHNYAFSAWGWALDSDLGSDLDLFLFLAASAASRSAMRRSSAATMSTQIC